MKKAFYSEILNKYFDSEEECVKAELVEKRNQEASTQNKKTVEKSDSRKQAAKVVEEAKQAFYEALDNLKKVEQEAKKALQAENNEA